MTEVYIHGSLQARAAANSQPSVTLDHNIVQTIYTVSKQKQHRNIHCAKMEEDLE